MKGQVSQWANRMKSQTWIWDDTYSRGAINHLSALLNEIIPSKLKHIYGAHFIFNTQANLNLGSDGYDNYQAPMSETGTQLFKRRMWVNGYLRWYGTGPKCNDQIRCIEKIRSARSIGSNAFVSIDRDFTLAGETPVMEEMRTLVYTNQSYTRPEVSGRADKIENIITSKNVRISLDQVMKFSSLSYNLHKIHYDAQYCHLEGLDNVVASGPLLVLILLHFFASVYPESAIRSFKYRNSEPCYIDEDVTLVLLEGVDGFDLCIEKDGRKLCSGTLVAQDES